MLSTSRFRTFTVALVAALPALQAVAQSGSPAEPGRSAPVSRILIDRTLSETSAKVVSIDGTAVHFLGLDEPPEAPHHSRPHAELLAVLSGPMTTPRNAPAIEEAVPVVRVLQTDGHIFVGRIGASEEGKSETLVLYNATIGEVSIAIDDLARIEVLNQERPEDPPRPQEGESSTEDMVELANGDVLRGFVERLGSQIEIKPDGAQEPTTISIDRVRRVSLANSQKPVHGMRLWLTDGSCIGAREFGKPSDAGAAVSLHADGRWVTIPLPAIAAVCFDTARIASLSDISPSEYRAAADRRWTRPPTMSGGTGAPFGSSTVLLPGPMSVDWSLPAGASHFGAWVELAPATETWGDCSVSVDTIAPDGTVKRLATVALSSGSPRTRVQGDVAESAKRLRVTVESGSRGPILDRVALDRAFLVLKPK